MTPFFIKFYVYIFERCRTSATKTLSLYMYIMLAKTEHKPFCHWVPSVDLAVHNNISASGWRASVEVPLAPGNTCSYFSKLQPILHQNLTHSIQEYSFMRALELNSHPLICGVLFFI